MQSTHISDTTRGSNCIQSSIIIKDSIMRKSNNYYLDFERKWILCNCMKAIEHISMKIRNSVWPQRTSDTNKRENVSPIIFESSWIIFILSLLNATVEFQLDLNAHSPMRVVYLKWIVFLNQALNDAFVRQRKSLLWPFEIKWNQSYTKSSNYAVLNKIASNLYIIYNLYL